MHSFEKLAVLVAVFALSAVGSASASAAAFTYSATGDLTSQALETHVFTTNGGKVQCAVASGSGTIDSTNFTSEHMTVQYSGCTAFGFASVHISDAAYEFTAHTEDNVHIENAIEITPTFFGSSLCTVTVAPQTVGTVDYNNVTAGTVEVDPTVTGIDYTSSGGVCGTAGEYTDGTYEGASVVSRVGGGSIQHDH